jgi:hypothetical protein
MQEMAAIDARDLIENKHCFDFVQYDHVSIKSWLKENKGSIIILDPTGNITCYQRTTLASFVDDPNSNFVKCHRYLDEDEKLIIEEKDNRILVKIQTLQGVWGVLQSDILNNVLLRKRLARIFQIVRTSDHWNRSESEDVKHHGADLISNWHCQEGTSLDICELKPIALENMLEIVGQSEEHEFIFLVYAKYKDPTVFEPNLRKNEPIINPNLGSLAIERAPSAGWINPRRALGHSRNLSPCLAALSFSIYDKKRDITSANKFAFFSSWTKIVEDTDIGRNGSTDYVFCFYHDSEDLNRGEDDVEFTNVHRFTPQNTVLKNRSTQGICLGFFTQEGSLSNPPTLVSSVIINYVQEEQDYMIFAAQFDTNDYFGETENTVYFSRSLSNLLRFVCRTMYEKWYGRHRGNGYLTYFPPEMIMDTNYIITEEFEFFTLPDPPAPVLKIKESHSHVLWRYGGIAALYALPYSDSIPDADNCNSFKLLMNVPSSETININSWIFGFVSHIGDDYRLRFTENDRLQDEFYVFLIYKKDNGELSKFYARIGACYVPRKRRHWFSLEFDRYYFDFEKEYEGVDDDFFVSESLLDLLRFAQATMTRSLALNTDYFS